MHGLPKDTDLSSLIQKTVEQICVGLFEIILRFDKDVTVTIEGKFAYALEEVWEAGQGNLPVSSSKLFPLLGKTVEEVVIQEQGTLQMRFSNGGTLRLYDSNQHAESYQITWPQHVVVV